VQVGKDVVKLLSDALNRKGVDMRVAALVRQFKKPFLGYSHWRGHKCLLQCDLSLSSENLIVTSCKVNFSICDLLTLPLPTSTSIWLVYQIVV
jgi:hypothetical protein